MERRGKKRPAASTCSQMAIPFLLNSTSITNDKNWEPEDEQDSISFPWGATVETARTRSPMKQEAEVTIIDTEDEEEDDETHQEAHTTTSGVTFQWLVEDPANPKPQPRRKRPRVDSDLAIPTEAPKTPPASGKRKRSSSDAGLGDSDSEDNPQSPLAAGDSPGCSARPPEGPMKGLKRRRRRRVRTLAEDIPPELEDIKSLLCNSNSPSSSSATTTKPLLTTDSIHELWDYMEKRRSTVQLVTAARQSRISAHVAATSAASSSSSSAEDKKALAGKRPSPPQKAFLNLIFFLNPRPDSQTKKQIAIKLGRSLQQINVWFQNKRARSKRRRQQAAAAQGAEGGEEAMVFHLTPGGTLTTTEAKDECLKRERPRLFC